MIKEFEEISKLENDRVRELLKDISPEVIVKAYKGTSPENAEYLKETFKEIDFEKKAAEVGRVRIEEVEKAQQEIIDKINKS